MGDVVRDGIVKNLKWNKYDSLVAFIVLANLLLVTRVIEVSYDIVAVSYLYVIGLFLVALAMYYIYSQFLRKNIFKLGFWILFMVTTAVFVVKDGFGAFIGFDESFSNIEKSIGAAKQVDFANFKIYYALAVPIIIFLVLCLARRGLGNVVLIFTLAIFITLWYTGFDVEVKGQLFEYIIISTVTYGTMKYVGHINKLMRQGIMVQDSIMKFIGLIVVIAVSVAFGVKASPQNYKGKFNMDWFNKYINKSSVASVVSFDLESKKYDLAYSGYNDSTKKLGGPITINKSVVLKVKSNETYYLRGNIRTEYNGYSWKAPADNKYFPIPEREKNPKGNSDSYIEGHTSIEIQPEGRSTNSIFTPAGSYNCEWKKDIIYRDKNDIFIANKIVNSPYKVSFYTYRAEFEKFETLDKAILVDETNGGHMSILDKQSLYQQELQVPSYMPKEIINLVNRITAGCKTDAEKVIKIRNYLKNNYKYSLDVSPVPQSREFVDYFINTEKKGYCVYFATAATMFCRIAGVPARYVEGYMMTNKKDSDGLYVVTNENAHAWTEVKLFQGGQDMWLTLDCVPNAVAELQAENDKKSKEEEQKTKPTSVTPANNNKADDNKFKASEKSSDSLDTKLAVKNFNLKDMLKTARAKEIAILLVIVILAAVYIGVRYGVIYITRRRIIKAAGVIPLYIFMLRRLKTIKVSQANSLGDFEFAKSIEDDKLRIKVEQITKLVYSEYYGNKKATDFAKEESYDFIEKYIKDEQGAVRYFIYKILFW